MALDVVVSQTSVVKSFIITNSLYVYLRENFFGDESGCKIKVSKHSLQSQKTTLS